MKNLNPFYILNCLYSVRRLQKKGGDTTSKILYCKKNTSGDTEAFDILVRKYYSVIYQFCYRRLNGDTDTAADITQDVFLKLLENIHTVRMLGKFQNYLLTIAANTCNNYFKKAKPTYTDLNALDIIDDTNDTLEKVIENENKIEVRRALHSLPDYQKEVIILRFYHNLKIREIAKITKSNIPTVKSRLRQGLQKIERYLKDFKGGDNV